MEDWEKIGLTLPASEENVHSSTMSLPTRAGAVKSGAVAPTKKGPRENWICTRST